MKTIQLKTEIVTELCYVCGRQVCLTSRSEWDWMYVDEVNTDDKGRALEPEVICRNCSRLILLATEHLLENFNLSGWTLKEQKYFLIQELKRGNYTMLYSIFIDPKILKG